ncbi:ATP-dependent DNA helicase PcrA, partial [Streptococcus suis]
LDNLKVTQEDEAVLNQTGYIDAIAAQKTLEANARIENIQEFISVTKNFDEKYDEEEETGLDRLTRLMIDFSLIEDT